MKISRRKKSGSAGASVKEGCLYVHSFKSPFGLIELAATEKGVCRIVLSGESESLSRYIEGSPLAERRIITGGEENRKAARQLKGYFKGRRKTFDFKLDLQVDGFRRRTLLQGVRKIPYGQTRTYGEVARMVGSPRAYRAVGSANANNPLPLVIPCHRVVAANGLGGFGGGEDLKRALLELEGVVF